MTFTIIDVSNIYLARHYDLISEETFRKLHVKLNPRKEANAMVERLRDCVLDRDGDRAAAVPVADEVRK